MYAADPEGVLRDIRVRYEGPLLTVLRGRVREPGTVDIMTPSLPHSVLAGGTEGRILPRTYARG